MFLGVTLKCYKIATDGNRAEESEEGKSHISITFQPELFYISEQSVSLGAAVAGITRANLSKLRFLSLLYTEEEA